LKQLGRVTAALLLVILIMGGVIAYVSLSYEDQSSSQSSADQSQSSLVQGQASTIQSQSSALRSQSSALSKSQNTITSLEANLTAATKSLNGDSAQVANLTATIAADQSQIAAIESGYSQANGTIATLETSVTPLQAQVASLQKQVAGFTTQIAGLQTQVSSLQSQVTQLTSIATLGQGSIRLSQQFVGVASISSQVVTSFVANYSGYVTVSMSTISDIAEVQAGVIIVFAPSVISGQYSSEPVGPYSFTTVPDQLVFPVTPGDITVYLANAASSPQNATVTVTYYY
jgi:uncharacterized coiled-coil protein SlyX